MSSAGATCGHCGKPLDNGNHDGCMRLLAMEPPRYCAACGRRMKVQVSPTSWTAACVEHGNLSSDG